MNQSRSLNTLRSLCIISLIGLGLITIIATGGGGGGGDRGDDVAEEPIPEGIILPSEDRIVIDPEVGFSVVKDEIAIRFQDSTSVDTIRSTVRNIGGTIIGSIDELSIYQVQIEGADLSRIRELKTELDSNPNVDFSVEHWLALGNLEEPDDPLWDSWDSNNPHGNNWGQEFINLPEAWEYETGHSDTVISIIDTGFDVDHEDIEENISSYVYYASLGTIAGGDHGTFVTGIAGAKGNNGIGISGVCWDCSLSLFRYGIDSNGSNLALVEAIKDEVINGAKVINISQGVERGCDLVNPHVCDDFDILWTSAMNCPIAQAMNWVNNNDYEVLFVFAAGNDNANVDCYPGASLSSTFSNVITVAASDQNGVRWNCSNYGSLVDVAAPGFDIYSTIANNGYGSGHGTSISAPFVTGLAALLWSKDPNLSPSEVKQLIIDGAKNGGKLLHTPDGNDFYVIDAYESFLLLLSETMDPAPVTHLRIASQVFGEVTLQWDANTESNLAGYKVYYDTDPDPPYAGIGALEGNSPIEVYPDYDENPDPNIVEYTIHDLPNETCYFAVTAFNTDQLESGFSNEIRALGEFVDSIDFIFDTSIDPTTLTHEDSFRLSSPIIEIAPEHEAYAIESDVDLDLFNHTQTSNPDEYISLSDLDTYTYFFIRDPGCPDYFVYSHHSYSDNLLTITIHHFHQPDVLCPAVTEALYLVFKANKSS
jgi:hypothetical protein